MDRDESFLQILNEHFRDIDRLCQLLEELTSKMAEMDERIHTLELLLPKKDDDNEKGSMVLA